MNHRPVVLGLLPCEQVIIEESTRNVTPVNCFTQRIVRQLPSEAFPFIVFAILTDAAGEIPLEIVIQRLDSLDEIYRRSVVHRFADRLREIRCLFRIRDCSFPIAGAYQVSLLADGELQAQRKIMIEKQESSK